MRENALKVGENMEFASHGRMAMSREQDTTPIEEKADLQQEFSSKSSGFPLDVDMKDLHWDPLL